MPDPDSTRARLLDAAAAQIVERGWGGVSTRAIAEAAGVNQGVVHYHFDSVAALKREAVVRALTRAVQAPLEALSGLPPEEIIRLSVAVTDAFDLRSSIGMLVYESVPAAARDPELAATLRTPLLSFRQLLAASIAAHCPTPAVAPEILAELVAAVIDGLQLHLLIDPTIDIGAHVAPLLALLGPAEPDNGGAP